VDVIDVDLDRSLALTDTGVVLVIDTFFDEFGDECDADDAVACVATDGWSWFAIDLRVLFERSYH
jgi:hypothetical protein